MFASDKRPREDDVDDIEVLRNNHKRPRTLPFRTSPLTKHTHLPSPRSVPQRIAITPPESSEDEEPPYLTSIQQYNHASSGSRIGASLYPFQALEDEDSDMTDSQPPGSPHPWEELKQTHITSPRPSAIVLPQGPFLAPQQPADNTRIPTPIYGYFRSTDAHMDDLDIRETPPSAWPAPEPRAVPKQQQHRPNTVTSRRLPSPISEDGVMDAQSCGPLLDHESYGCGEDIKQPLDADVNDAALQAGSRGKVTLSMGYRADCEKCKTNVPGHWNHIIRG